MRQSESMCPFRDATGLARSFRPQTVIDGQDRNFRSIAPPRHPPVNKVHERHGVAAARNRERDVAEPAKDRKVIVCLEFAQRLTGRISSRHAGFPAMPAGAP